MKPETAGKIIFGASGLIIGAVIAMIIGFNWGGWVTSSTTKTMTQTAILASKAAICTSQFVKDPNYEENLNEFEKLDNYGMNSTSDYVRKFGWDKMPGEEKPDSNVAYACAKGIELIIKKGDK